MPSDFAEWLDFRTFRFVRDEAGQLTPLPSRSGERAFLVFDSQRLRYARLHVFEDLASDTEKTWWLRREMDAISHLNLPAFSSVLESGEDEEGLYYVDDFPGGEPVKDWLERTGPHTPYLAVSVIRQLIELLSSATPRPRAIDHFDPELLWIRSSPKATVEINFSDYSGWSNQPLENEAPLVKKLASFLLKMVGGRGCDPQVTMLCETALTEDSPMTGTLAGFDQALEGMIFDQAESLPTEKLPQEYLHEWLIEGTQSTDEGDHPYSLGTSYQTGGKVLVLPGVSSVPNEFLHPQHLYGMDCEKITEGQRCRLLSETEDFSELESLRERIKRTGPQPLSQATALIEAVISAADTAEPTVPIVHVAPDDILYPPTLETETPTHFRLYPTTPRLIKGLDVPDAVSAALLENRSALPQARRSALALSLFWFVSTGKERFPWDPAIRLRDDRLSSETLRLLDATRTRLAEFPASEDGTLIEQLRDIASLTPHPSQETELDLVEPNEPENKQHNSSFGFSRNWSTVAACFVFGLSLLSLAMYVFRSNPTSENPTEETGARFDNRAPDTKTAGGEMSEEPSSETASSNVPTTLFPETAMIQNAITSRRINLPPSVILPTTEAPLPGSSIDTTFPDASRASYLQEAQTAFEEGAYGRTLNLSLEVLSEDPGRAEARILLTRTIAAWLASGKGIETDREAELLREASEIVPSAATLLVGHDESSPTHWLARSASSGRLEHMRELGLQMQPDNPIALEWLARAAEGGDFIACFHLADRLIKGIGCNPDQDRAFHLLQAASRAGHANSINLLGMCYKEGWGTAINADAAYQHFLQAAVMDNSDSQYNLANCHASGFGTEKNLTRAAELYSLGAESGHPDSMLAWSKCLEHGAGVEANRKEAFAWYERTANTGNMVARTWCRENGIAFGFKIP